MAVLKIDWAGKSDYHIQIIPRHAELKEITLGPVQPTYMLLIIVHAQESWSAIIIALLFSQILYVTPDDLDLKFPPKKTNQ